MPQVKQASTVGRWRRVAAMGLSIAVLTTLLTVIQPPLAAEAVSGKDFNPELIITDSEFYNGKAMSEAQIQTFLVAKNSVLKSFRGSVLSRDSESSRKTGNLICSAFQGGSDLAAATIIYRAQAACGISAKTLLVTLQKEQGLIQKSSATQRALDRAMGMACPDTAPCAEYALGFGNQVFLAARQFNVYKADRWGMQPGTHSIRWHPTTACGASTLNIRNHATVALYNYTPYRPNAAALASYPGLGDKCSSYGNRNFWFLYNAWFGSPTDIKPTGVKVSRVGGTDRFDTATKIAARNYQADTTNTVYIANGLDYPDAVSAAPAAASHDAPLLLVQRNVVPATVKSEIQRLQPEQIVVVGGKGVVSDAVYGQLAKLAPKIRRDSGADRYDTSRAIAAAAFSGTGSTVAYIATGAGFPDALSASAVAGSLNAPVILVDGRSKTLDDATKTLLASLGVTDIVIAGGTGVVSAGIEKALNGAGLKVVRKGGADRYDTSAALNAGAFTSAGIVHVASGKDFPDALAAAALAGRNAAPLYLVMPTCIEKAILQQIVDLGAADMVIYGGTGVVGNGVVKFVNCK